LQQHRAKVWLVNTGWIGGPHGVGQRMKLSLTRAIIDAIHGDVLANAPTKREPVFGLSIVSECPGVPRELLIPRDNWADANSYDATARKLAALFQDNFRKYTGK